MSKPTFRYFSCDFETTVYKGQDHTEVWASASVELGTEDVQIFGSISEQFEYFKSLNCNIIGYYHNLKFDGNFWLSYLMVDLGMKEAVIERTTDTQELDQEWMDNADMPSNTFKYSISNMGQWYTITIKVGTHIIEFRDSLKLLPFSVKEIGKAFKTKHQKLDMEYVGFRYSGCTITEEERKYIANDVLVVKEALEIMNQQGHNKLTIGACCLSEFKKTFLDTKDYDTFFPDLTEQEISKDMFGYDNVDKYIRNSYKGGWCYLVRGKENKIYEKGVTADVNSLYPSMMSSESGNKYPYGLPTFWKGNYIPPQAIQPNTYYFVRIRTRFYIKENYLPFIQIKHSFIYNANDMLETSDYYNKEDGKYYRYYRNDIGELRDTRVTMVLTMTDYELIKEHYELVDFEILDGCMFRSTSGLFDQYIEKYKKQKLESKGALRTLAKLFLNNLYGKMASSDDSSYKRAYVKEDKTIGFYTVPQHDKKSGYIAVGSAITSYARNFTIRAAQKNYHGVNNKGFIYADTDSIHCDIEPQDVQGITVHDKNFCCWKLEASWDKAIFVRQKTYIEHVTHEDLEPIEAPYYNVKCAGMPQKCKNLFVRSMDNTLITEDEKKQLTDEEKEFLFDENGVQIVRTLDDFKIGLTVPDKLMPRRIRGGVLLVETTYQMR